jgi:hypothetical protein
LSRKYATPLRLEIRPSRTLGYWVSMAYSLPLLLLPFLQLPGWLNLVLLMLLTGGFIRTWRSQVLLLHQDAVQSLHWGEEKHCLLGLRSGSQQQKVLCNQVFLMPWLVILYFNKTGFGKDSLLLLPDMVDPETFRKLRIRLQLEINKP